MSAYKKFNAEDVYLTTYTSHKKWTASGSILDSYGIDKSQALSGSLPLYPSDTNYYERLKYQSIKHLYFHDATTGSFSGSYEHYLETSFFSGSRQLGEEACVISIPKIKTGTFLNPTTVVLTSGDNIIYDNGEGFLKYKTGSNINFPTTGSYVGDVIYRHGLLILTSESVASYFNGLSDYTLEWESTLPIYTTVFNCKVKDYELNFTSNPSALSGSALSADGRLNGNVTGSYFQPYVTTVGLYNDANELLAVGKLSQPTPKSKETEMTFVVRIDL